MVCGRAVAKLTHFTLVFFSSSANPAWLVPEMRFAAMSRDPSTSISLQQNAVHYTLYCTNKMSEYDRIILYKYYENSTYCILIIVYKYYIIVNKDNYLFRHKISCHVKPFFELCRQKKRKNCSIHSSNTNSCYC